MLAAASILANLLRGDRSTVALYPGVLTVFVVTAVLYVGLELNRHNVTNDVDERRSGYRTVFVTSAVFAILLTAFAAVWLSSVKVMIAVVVLAGAFLSTLAVGCFFVWLRSTKRPETGTARRSQR
jgi:hypothetical protein